MIKAKAVSVRTSKQILVVYYLITVHLTMIYLIADKLMIGDETTERIETASVERSAIEPDQTATPQAESSLPSDGPEPKPVAPGTGGPQLLIPVAGVAANDLTSSFSDSRGDGRVHDAIDIPAAAGTPVIAAADGRIIKFFESEAGGTTIYQLSTDEKYVYYYAHLQRRADDLKVDDEVKQGRTIGFVGDTGNAGAGNYHLHFSIMAVPDPKRYWEGVYVDPYPLLTR